MSPSHHCSLLLPQLLSPLLGPLLSCPLNLGEQWGSFSFLSVFHLLVHRWSQFCGFKYQLLYSDHSHVYVSRRDPSHASDCPLIFPAGIATLTGLKRNSSYSLNLFFPQSPLFQDLTAPFFLLSTPSLESSLMPLSSSPPLCLSSSSANPEIDPQFDHFSPPPPLPFFGLSHCGLSPWTGLPPAFALAPCICSQPRYQRPPFHLC